MIDQAEGDAAVRVLERRWFACMTAIRELEAHCELLREAVEHTEGAWRRTRVELAKLEAVRDALGEELAEREGLTRVRAPADVGRARPSAA